MKALKTALIAGSSGLVGSQLLSDLLEQVENLEFIYRQKLTALDDLKKSLLHQAFSGQL